VPAAELGQGVNHLGHGIHGHGGSLNHWSWKIYWKPWLFLQEVWRFPVMSTPDETKPWFMKIRGLLLQ